MGKKSWLKWIGLIIVAAFLIIGVPIIINELYKSNSGYMTMWGAKDVLSYYGTVLGSAVAVAVLAETIHFTRKKIQRETYLKTEKEKWVNLDRIISDTLVELNPVPVFQAAPNIGSSDTYNAISVFYDYMRKCNTSTDIISVYLSVEDMPTIENLTFKIKEASIVYFKIAKSATDTYKNWFTNTLKGRATISLNMEAHNHGTISEN